MLNESFKQNALKFWPWSVFFVVLIFIDQLVKFLAHNIFYNSAFAFSLPVPPVFMYIIYFVVLAAMIFYVFENYKQFTFYIFLAWVLIFAGAVSNIFERIIFGQVKDFIYITFYKWTGVYNLADFYILLGVIFLLFSKSYPPVGGLKPKS